MQQGSLIPDGFESEDQIEPVRGPSLGRWAFFCVLAIIGILVIRSFTSGPSNAMADWGHDWDQGVETAAKTGKPLMVLFTADWCPPCKQLKSEVFGDEEVAAKLKTSFALVKIDLTESGGANGALAQNYSVRGIPSLIVFNSKGDQIDRVSGYGDKDNMLQWINAAYQKAK